MLVSMTGYGKAECNLATKKIQVDIRSLNSKQADINTRLSGYYREKEIEVRKILLNELIRGKIDFGLYVETTADESSSVINVEVVKSYYNQLKPIASDLNAVSNDSFMSLIMLLPNVLKTERVNPNEEEWEVIKSCIKDAIADLHEFRKQEGASLEVDIRKRIENIQNLLKQVEPLEENRLKRVKERLRNNLKELINSNNFDENRFEQELIFYIEKYDITEEKVRLDNHCEYFFSTMAQNEPVGKKLGFISQEIGREINTLGSKANDSDIQKIVVLMKDELEKIKEQLLNVL